MKPYLLCFYFVILLSLSCHKTKQQFLQPSQSGQNIVAFTVNGQQHVYRGFGSYFNPNGIFFGLHHIPDTVLTIEISASSTTYYGSNAYNDGLDFFTVIGRFVQLNIPYHIGTYRYNPTSYAVFDKQHNLIDSYLPDTLNSNLTITRYDSSVCAGTFQYKGRDTAGNAVSLINGFFDISRK